MKKSKRLLSFVSAMAIAAGAAVPGIAGRGTGEVKAAGGPVMEYLNRGISAINTGKGMLVSWRFKADDSNSAEFKLYRDDKLIYTSGAGKATCYLDKDGKSSSAYRVDTIEGGKVVSSEKCSLISNSNYFTIKTDKPKGNGCTYMPNDCSVGDVDGDGQYEIFLKWDPSNQKDNSQKGDTGNVFIDCYTLQGKRLWRIDLGRNIRAGQHYTQFLVADFDGDGKAEMTCKTADGTVDGTGKVIGDKSKNYRNGDGYVLSGPEYYTLFEGATGKALDTVDYAFPRGTVKNWGDNYGNRVDRFLGTVAYFEEGHPTAVSVRGYYTRMTLVAYDVKNKKLVERWKYDSGNDKKKGYSNGNHNIMPADVDGDGKQELFLGATCIDDNGKLLWCNGRGHGDALHIGDLDPNRKGLEAWVCHEETGGVTLLDARTGDAIFHKSASGDTGRCCGDNVYAGNAGAELWGAESNNVYTVGGKSIGTKKPPQSFLCYWDGDLEREILDGTKVTKYKSPNDVSGIFTADGCTSINGSKNNPSLSADIFGDWREEIIWPASDGNSIRIYGTSYNTDVRLTTLMHEPQYRNGVASEQTCYNQPPHTAFWLGSEVKNLPRPAVQVRGSKVPQDVTPPSSEPVASPSPSAAPSPSQQPAAPGYAAAVQDGAVYRIQNVNSGLYLEVDGGLDTNAANVQQTADKGAAGVLWKAVAAEGGYYKFVSQTGAGKLVLDIEAKSAENGTNVQIYNDKDGDNQKFKPVQNADGSYKLLTKISNDKSCVEIRNAEKDPGSNAQEWEVNGYNCQDWIFECVAGNAPAATSAPSQAPVTTPSQAPVTEPVTTPSQAPVTTPSQAPVTEPVTTPSPSQAPSSEPVTTPSPSQAPAAVMLGDYDGNGAVDISDLSNLSLALVDHKVLPDDVKLRMDVDRDGSVTLADLAKMRQYVSKIIDKF